MNLKLKYFRLNYYAFVCHRKGFPIGEPIQSFAFEAPAESVAMDEPSMFGGSSLEKAAKFARALGYTGTFGIEELGTEPRSKQIPQI